MNITTPSLRGLVCAAALVPLGSAQAAFSVLENFEGLTPGALGTQNGWTSDADYNVVADPAGGANQVLEFAGSAQAGAFLALNGSGIADGSTGTLFARFRSSATSNGNFGLSDVAAPSAFGSFEAQINRQPGTDIQGRDAGTFQILSSGAATADQPDVWYNLWIVANNGTDTSQIFIQSDGDSDFLTQTEIAPPDGTLNFRNGTTDALSTLMLRSSAAGVFFDDFYISDGTDLTNPVAIPEPSSSALALLGMAALLRRKRR